MLEIGPEPGGQLAAVAASDGAQVKVNVDASGGTCPGPVTDATTNGRSFDHEGRHGVLAYPPQERKAGIRSRGQGAHQHSPCANRTPNLRERFIAAEHSAPL